MKQSNYHFSEIRRWTRLAKDCYSIGCNCNNCKFHSIVENLESTNKCLVKGHVIELVRKFGIPTEKAKPRKPAVNRPTRKVKIIETGEIFASVRELAKYLNCRENPIYLTLRGYQKSIKGYKVEYLKG